MKKNESTIDRTIRAGVAVVATAGAAAVGFSSVAGLVLMAVATIMAVTAAVGFCPIYRVIGISTCPVHVADS